MTVAEVLQLLLWRLLLFQMIACRQLKNNGGGGGSRTRVRNPSQ